MKNIILLMACAIAVISCRDGKTEAPKQPADAPAESKPDTLKAFVVKAEKMTKTVTLPAELTPYERVNISAKIPAYIRQIKVDIGTVVKKGQVLVVMEAPELNAKTAEAAARAETVKAKMKTSHDLYQRNLAASKVEGAVAAAEVERSHNQYLTDNAEYEAAQRYAASISEMQQYLTLTAPFDGIITARNMDVGSLAGNGDQPVLVMENNQTLRLRVPVPEAYASCGLGDRNISFTLKAEPTQIYTAMLARKSEAIDPATRTEVWEFSVPNSARSLKSGMFANARLSLVRPAATPTVPHSAVATTLERKFIVRIRQGAAEWVDVQQGMSLPDRVEVFGGLAPGDTVLVKAGEEVKEGARVVPKW